MMIYIRKNIPTIYNQNIKKLKVIKHYHNRGIICPCYTLDEPPISPNFVAKLSVRDAAALTSIKSSNGYNKPIDIIKKILFRDYAFKLANEKLAERNKIEDKNKIILQKYLDEKNENNRKNEIQIPVIQLLQVLQTIQESVLKTINQIKPVEAEKQHIEIKESKETQTHVSEVVKEFYVKLIDQVQLAQEIKREKEETKQTQTQNNILILNDSEQNNAKILIKPTEIEHIEFTELKDTEIKVLKETEVLLPKSSDHIKPAEVESEEKGAKTQEIETILSSIQIEPVEEEHIKKEKITEAQMDVSRATEEFFLKTIDQVQLAQEMNRAKEERNQTLIKPDEQQHIQLKELKDTEKKVLIETEVLLSKSIDHVKPAEVESEEKEGTKGAQTQEIEKAISSIQIKPVLEPFFKNGLKEFMKKNVKESNQSSELNDRKSSVIKFLSEDFNSDVSCFESKIDDFVEVERTKANLNDRECTDLIKRMKNTLRLVRGTKASKYHIPKLESKYNIKISDQNKTFTKYTDYFIIEGKIDGYIKEEETVLELKYRSKNESSTSKIDKIQTMLYMELVGTKKCKIIEIFGNSNDQITEIDYDDSVVKNVFQSLENFVEDVRHFRLNDLDNFLNKKDRY